MKKKINDVEDMEVTFYNLYNKGSKNSNGLEKEALSLEDVKDWAKKYIPGLSGEETSEEENSGGSEKAAKDIVAGLTKLIPLLPSLYTAYKIVPTGSIRNSKYYSGTMKDKIVQFIYQGVKEALPGLGMAGALGPEKVIKEALAGAKIIFEIVKIFNEFKTKPLSLFFAIAKEATNIEKPKLEELSGHLNDPEFANRLSEDAGVSSEDLNSFKSIVNYVSSRR